ncbi:hypothetical protein KAI87_15030 [Myxococcota bacterium]|nr:hypothetical protein [Myxococcota bacterium]
MSERRFIAQALLEEWLEKDEVTFDSDVLILKGDQRKFSMEAAVSIKTVIDGIDHKNLVGQTLSATEIHNASMEHYGTSLLDGETAYECEEGFLSGEIDPPAAAPVPAPVPVDPVVAEEPEDNSADDAAMLSDFLLKHL